MLDGNKLMGEVQSGAIPELHSFNGKRYISYFYDNDGIQYVKLGEAVYELVKDVLGNVVMVVATKEGKVACFYDYNAFGSCTVLDANGNTDTDPTSIGNTNPIRWKGFYYDTEIGFYYANGSYYDPTTGTYLDASPITTVIDNAFNTRSLDRNAPVCNNILELAGNPYTVATASNLSPDPTYYPYKNAPWYIKAAVWFSKIAWYKKLFIGVMLLAFAVLFTVISGGSIPALMYSVAKGVLLGIGFWAASTLFVGEKLTWEGLGNAALDAFLVTSAIEFVTSAVNFVKYCFRSGPQIIDGVEIQHAQKSDFTSESWDRIQSLQHRSDGSTISSLKDGRLIHKGFKADYIGLGKEKTISGFGRADCVVGNTIYELKPNNAWSITKGIQQLHGYNMGLGGGYKLVLVLY